MATCWRQPYLQVVKPYGTDLGLILVTAHRMGRPRIVVGLLPASRNMWPKNGGPTTSYFWSSTLMMCWRPTTPRHGHDEPRHGGVRE